MSILRGAQSALFYYVSCTPYSKYKRRRKRKKENERDRAARAAYDEEHGHEASHYRQPSPYSRNEYWEEEIRSGPGPPPRRANKKKRNRAISEATAKSDGTPKIGAIAAVNGAALAPAAPDLASIDSVKNILSGRRPSGAHWNSKRYQREDEALWGLERRSSDTAIGSSPRDLALARTRSVSGGSSVGVPGVPPVYLPGRTSRIADVSTESVGYATPPRAPPINDLHPPVVSMPVGGRDRNRWMLQPPPSPRVMNGYEAANADSGRSRSGSGASSRRNGGADSVSLGRQISARVIEDKLRRGERLRGTEHMSSERLSAKSRRSTLSARDHADTAAAPFLHPSDDATVPPARAATARGRNPQPPRPANPSSHPRDSPTDSLARPRSATTDQQHSGRQLRRHHRNQRAGLANGPLAPRQRKAPNSDDDDSDELEQPRPREMMVLPVRRRAPEPRRGARMHGGHGSDDDDSDDGDEDDDEDDDDGDEDTRDGGPRGPATPAPPAKTAHLWLDYASGAWPPPPVPGGSVRRRWSVDF